MNYCENCKHFSLYDCEVNYTSLIDGKRINLSCQHARECEGYCGVGAKYFEPGSVDNPEDYALHLSTAHRVISESIIRTIMDDGELWAGFYAGGVFHALGYFYSGRCNILKLDSEYDNYLMWVGRGKKVDTTAIKWDGREYYIGEDLILHCTTGDDLYDFEQRKVCDNLERKEK